MTIASLVLAAALAGGATHSLDDIAVYQGTWNVHLTYYATTYSKARDVSNTVRNECWRSSDFYACHQFIDNTSGALIVYTYDATDDSFVTHPVVQGKGPAPGGILRIDGTTWTYPWTDTDGAKTVYFRVVNVFSGRDAITFRQEYSLDNVHWTRMADGRERRVGS